MAAPSPLAGVISPEICWSAHDNELRVHSTAGLEPHAGHGVTGLPEQACFRFVSGPEPERHRKREPVRGAGSRTTLIPCAKRSKPRGSPQQQQQLSPTLAMPPAAAETNRNVKSLGASSSAAVEGAAGARANNNNAGSSPARTDSPAGVSPPVRAKDARARHSSPPRSPRGGNAASAPKRAAGKLSVRAVEAVEIGDGRTVLVCLVSERELASEVHCVDPISGDILHAATGLPILLTSLAVLPLAGDASNLGNGSGSGLRFGSGSGLRRETAAASSRHRHGPELSVGGGATGLSWTGQSCDDGDEEEIVVAVGGVGGRVTLISLPIPRRGQQHQEQQQALGSGKRGRPISVNRAPYREWPRAEHGLGAAVGSGDGPRGVGGVPSEREGVPITALSAFSVPVGDRDDEARSRPGPVVVTVAMVAVGWSDGSWAVAPCWCSRVDIGAGVDKKGGGTCADSLTGKEMPDCVWEKACSTSSGDLATGDTAGLGPALHFVHEERHGTSFLSQVASGPAKFRLWISTASGFLCFEPLLAGDGDGFSTQENLVPVLTRQRTLVPGVRPQSVQALVVGGGPSRALMIFTATRPPDASPVLLVLDTATALAAAPGEEDQEGNLRCLPLTPGASAGGGGDVRGGLVTTAAEEDQEEEEGEQEVELSTRCCSKSVFSASPHAVFVNPSEVKAFVCRRCRVRGRGGLAEGASTPAGLQAAAPTATAAPLASLPNLQDRAKKAIHLRFSMILAEASIGEAGRPRLRAWEQSHAGDAHAAAADLERLGHLAFCDPSEEYLDAETALHVRAVGEACLEHIVGGQQNLWARHLLTLGRNNNGGNDVRDISRASDGFGGTTTAMAEGR
ncbi:unnamed protein product, partial [Scytosiphon promiscuus]